MFTGVTVFECYSFWFGQKNLFWLVNVLWWLQEELKHKENQYEIVDFIVSKFKGAIGLGTGPSLPPMNKETEGMISGKSFDTLNRIKKSWQHSKINSQKKSFIWILHGVRWFWHWFTYVNLLLVDCECVGCDWLDF